MVYGRIKDWIGTRDLNPMLGPTFLQDWIGSFLSGPFLNPLRMGFGYPETKHGIAEDTGWLALVAMDRQL
ncbi:hypothetical protein TIFTF001_012042 [Ficus carica]|uniref:Uncharacterized protein n=1 Tax=Ficus carica TaxID=3494 RepID=A0AA88A1N1_FICCA|nr:hypothetical protein TIFTF001_012042 [Ficus carica]